MSAIVVTYIAPDALIEELSHPPKPTRWKAFLGAGPNAHDLAEGLAARSRRAETFDGSGWTFNPTLDFLEQDLAGPLARAREHPLARALRTPPDKALLEAFVVGAAERSAWLAFLEPCAQAPGRFLAFCREYYGVPDGDTEGDDIDIPFHVTTVQYLVDVLRALADGDTAVFTLT